MAVVLSGLIQIILSLLKAGVIANYFPSNVIKGMLSGIGIIIILKQIPHALGYDRDNEGDFAFLQLDGENTITSLFSAVHHVDIGATLITILGLAIIIAFEHKNLSHLRKLFLLD